MTNQKFVESELKRLTDLTEKATSCKVTAIKPMPGGLTNSNFSMTLDNGMVTAVRIPGPGTEKYINREAERHNLTMMGTIGIAPEIFYYDSESGTMISEYIHAETMHPEDFQTDYRKVVRAAGLMRTYHNCGQWQIGTFSPVGNVRSAYDSFKKENYEIPFKEQQDLWQHIKKVNRILENCPYPKVPGHNDPLSENFMFDGHTMTLIDWEYAGMNDCYYDLAAFVVENQLSPEMEEDFMVAYLGNNPSDEQKAHLRVYKFLLDSYVFHWALLQLAAGKDPAIYMPYAEERLKRAFGYVEAPDFEDVLDNLGKIKY